MASYGPWGSRESDMTERLNNKKQLSTKVITAIGEELKIVRVLEVDPWRGNTRVT